MCLSVDEAHLWKNVVLLLLSGALLESSEQALHAFEVAYGGGVLSVAGHGATSSLRIRGASGAVYAILWSQASLLLLNWSEMPTRHLRLLGLVLLLALEVLMFVWLGRETRTSYAGHAFGAVAGIAISLVSGRNVRFHHWELALNLLGLALYLCILVVALATSQYAATLWASALVPLLLVETARNVWRRARSAGGARASASSAGTPWHAPPQHPQLWHQAPPPHQQGAWQGGGQGLGGMTRTAAVMPAPPSPPLGSELSVPPWRDMRPWQQPAVWQPMQPPMQPPTRPPFMQPALMQPPMIRQPDWSRASTPGPWTPPPPPRGAQWRPTASPTPRPMMAGADPRFDPRVLPQTPTPLSNVRLPPLQP